MRNSAPTSLTAVSEEAGEGTRARERDLDRFLTFVDAIVAIAITLLVLPLVELGADLHGSVADLVREHAGQFLAFLLSFAVVGRLWYAQHLAVRSLVRMHGRLFVLLMLWCLTIVVLPFSTALVAQDPGTDRLTKVLYIGTAALSMAVLSAVDLLMARHPELTDGSPPPRVANPLVNTLLLLVALAIALVFPHTSYYPMLLLALDNVVLWLFRRHTPAAEATHDEPDRLDP